MTPAKAQKIADAILLLIEETKRSKMMKKLIKDHLFPERKNYVKHSECLN